MGGSDSFCCQLASLLAAAQDPGAATKTFDWREGQGFVDECNAWLAQLLKPEPLVKAKISVEERKRTIRAFETVDCPDGDKVTLQFFYALQHAATKAIMDKGAGKPPKRPLVML